MNLNQALEEFNDHLFDADLQRRLPIPYLDRLIIKIDDLI